MRSRDARAHGTTDGERERGERAEMQRVKESTDPVQRRCGPLEGPPCLAVVWLVPDLAYFSVLKLVQNVF